MFDEQGFSNNGLNAAGTEHSGYGREEVDKK